jgi:hypothetical protein
VVVYNYNSCFSGEVKVGGSGYEADPDQCIIRYYMKKQTENKRTRLWLSGRAFCLASARPCIQSPVLPKNKKNKFPPEHLKREPKKDVKPDDQQESK